MCPILYIVPSWELILILELFNNSQIMSWFFILFLLLNQWLKILPSKSSCNNIAPTNLETHMQTAQMSFRQTSEVLNCDLSLKSCLCRFPILGENWTKKYQNKMGTLRQVIKTTWDRIVKKNTWRKKVFCWLLQGISYFWFQVHVSAVLSPL